MLLTYLFAFCRTLIGLTFAASFLSKIRQTPRFVQAIAAFKLLPRRLHRPAAWLLLAGETAVTLLLLPAPTAAAGLLLAAFWLLLFTAALASVLARRIETACYCFGNGRQPVTRYDLWRNAILFLAAVVGWTAGQQPAVGSLNWLEWGVVAVPALAILLILTHLNDAAALFQPVWEE